MRRNVTYKTECLTCKEKYGKKRVYIGESARTAFERGQEHENDFMKRKEDSHMLKHWEEEHPSEERPIFSMKVLRGHTSAFVRQIHEAVLIEMNADHVLNSKGEYNRCQLPCLGVKMGKKDVGEIVKEMTEADIFSSVFESKKGKDCQEEHHDMFGHPGKRRKYRIRRPEVKTNAKRKRNCTEEPQEAKKPRSANGCTKAPTSNLPAEDNHLSRSNKLNNIEDSKTSKTPISENVKSSPSLLSIPSEKINTVSPKIKEIISIFEQHTASKPGQTNEPSKAKPNQNHSKLIKSKFKANPTSSPAATTPMKRIKRKSKLNPPNFNFRKISEHF